MTRQARPRIGAAAGRAVAAVLAAAAALLIAWPPPAAAAEQPAAPETIELKAAHLFDSTGSALEDGGTVVVRGDRIVSVGGTVPADARVLDLGDANRKVAAHCHGDTAARLAIAAGVDSIEHGSFLTEDPEAMKSKGIYLVPTRMAVYWVSMMADTYPPNIAAKSRAAAAAHGNMFKAALRIGVPIAFGTDAGVFPHGMNGMEFGLMTDLSMSPAAALLAGTRDAAKLLGVEADIGTLEAGKTADIVAVPGNVLSDIHATEHPVFVMHQGHNMVQKVGT